VAKSSSAAPADEVRGGCGGGIGMPRVWASSADENELREKGDEEGIACHKR